MAWISYKSYNYPSPEKFKQYRVMLFGYGVKGRKECAEYLHVSERAVQAWENQENNIPYANFKLLRMKATGRLLDSPEFEGFHVQGGTIYNHANQGFDHSQLKWISLYMQIARRAVSEYKDNRFMREIQAEEQRLKNNLGVKPRRINKKSSTYRKQKQTVKF